MKNKTNKTKVVVKKNEERYRGIFETSRDAIMTLEPPSWNFTSANLVTLKMFGVKNESEFLAYPPWKLSPKLQPDGQFSKEKAKEMIGLAMKKGSNLFTWTHKKVDGEEFFAEVFLSRIKLGRKVFLQAIVRDITARKRIEDALKEKANILEQAENIANLGTYVLNIKTGIWTSTKVLDEIFGINNKYSRSVEGWSKLILAEDRKMMNNYFTNEVLGKHNIFNKEYRIVRQTDKSVRWVHGMGQLIFNGYKEPIKMIGAIQDITERKKVEKILIDSEVTYREIFNASNDMVIVQDAASGAIVDYSKSVEDLTGYSRKEILTVGVFGTTPKDGVHTVEKAFKYIQKAKQGIPQSFEWVFQDKFGKIHPTETILKFTKINGIPRLLAIVHDITERKQAEEIIRKNELELKEAQRIGNFGNFDWDARTDKITWSDQYYRIYGFKPGTKPPGYKEHLKTYSSESAKRLDLAVKRSMKTGEPYTVDLEQVCSDGTRKWIVARGEVKRDENGKVIGLRGTAHDITKRIKAEKELERMNRTLRMLSDSNQTLIHISNERELLNKVCNIIVKTGGYRMAWIGLAECDKYKTIRPLAKAGYEVGYLGSIKLTWADTLHGRGPSGTAIRTGKIKIARNIAKDTAMTPWQKDAIRRGYKSSVALPLFKEGKIFGMLAIYSSDIDAFTNEEIKILKELSDDLSFGVTTLHINNVRKSLEEELQIIFDKSNDGILLAEIKSKKFSHANQTVCQMLGYKVEEIKKLSISDIHPKEHLAFVLKQFRNQAQGNISLAKNIPVKRKDGTIFYAEINSSSVNLGGKRYLLGMFRDVTENKKLQEVLVESETRFRSLYEQSPIAIFMVSLDGHFIHVNKAATKILGFSELELQKLTFGEITHPDERQRDVGKIKEMVSGRTSHYSVDKRYIRKDKKIINVHISVTLIRDKKQKPLYFLTFAEDITQHYQWIEAVKKSEEKYSNLVEHSSDGVVVIQDGLIKYANSAIKNITNLSPKDVVGRKMTDFIAPQYRKLVVSNYKRRMRGEKVENRYEFALIDNNGKMIPVETNSSSIIFEGRQADMAILRDITRAKEVDKIKSEFVSVASHQLRSPLTGIKWFSQLLIGQKVGKLSPKQLDFVEQIYNSNERMIRLVNDLLDVSHIETGQKFVIEKKPADIITLVTNVIKDQKINSPMRNITVELDQSCPNKLIFKFDQDKIYQLLSNLISNSIKYSPKDTKIIIGIKCLKNKVELFVKDFGFGIPAHQKNRVFQKFFRGDNIITVSTEGTGLGLYITKNIAEAHGGEVWFESEQNKGTTFYFTLPLKSKN